MRKIWSPIRIVFSIDAVGIPVASITKARTKKTKTKITSREREAERKPFLKGGRYLPLKAERKDSARFSSMEAADSVS